jgi:hypothetical protein
MENGDSYPDDFPLLSKDFNAKDSEYWTKG